MVDLQQILNVDFSHIEAKVSEIVKSDKSLTLVLGQLIDKYVWCMLVLGSDAKNTRSACFDLQHFICTVIKYEILLLILLLYPPQRS